MPIAGQSIDKALQLLKNKKLEPLKEFIDQSKGGYVHLEIFRDIIPGYQEGVLSIAEPKNLIQCSSKVNFLSTDQEIFYYYFEKGCIKDSVGGWKGFGFLEDSFTHAEKYNKFEKTFFDVYGTHVEEDDLFRTSIVYGQGCGIVGMPPEYQEKLDSLIKIRDVTTIRQWLRSPNSEKQLYAVQGLFKLERKLYYINTIDRRIIDIVKHKTGKVKVCYGCLHSQDEIKEVLFSIDNSLKKHKQTSTETAFAIFYFFIAIILLMFSIKSQQNQ